ncbi:hypothetical protein CMV30_01340 [Nibricoccus aquaticus]|uniref:Uncharacterized protein n=1 Tax=Nibricoccus aquaticus TaxID=2576891 RepID=A0A290QBM8_9BACT|nr:hypothetical protein [Nibricoccus aquaticus]ATC62718.1 hypothetical protein CMV30_01340 [Nibricoccus aquaticus]
MKRSYYIVPVILLALFGGLYWQHMGEMTTKANELKAKNLRIKAEEDAKKQEAERKAREDADKRIAVREAEEKKKEDDKEAKKKADIEKIIADTKRFNAQLADFTKQAATLDKELIALRAEKEKLGRDSFDMAKKVELAMVDKRTAEFQVQRMADMVAKRASDSTMTKLPTPPPAPAAK